ncbi:alpha/beta fold hydrolase [Sphingomonas fennica]|uniref:Alpha/beta hydrolase n=1 Tax=Edaphosphingomonas fennica TaxID=114404 RepID=A0A2T4I6Q1_9SPHN|nr:alpha/beta hydrolase [Sphingomonas fennica]PTD26293.1 alpha/beta hydrolase [Sphingomonas fennica]
MGIYEMDGGKLTGSDNDTERLPLLLVPGTLCDERVFTPVLALLPERSVSIAPLTDVSDVHEAARRILADAPPRFALLGFSLGGIVSLEIAATEPGRVAGLALIGSNARPVAPEFHAERRREAISGSENLDHYIRKIMWPRYVSEGRRQDAALQHLIAAMARDGGRQLLLNQTEIGLSRIDSRDRIARMTMPSLVLGGCEDALCTPEMQREMAHRLPDAQLALLPDAGHFVTLEQPEAVAAHISSWLERVDRVSA